MIKDHFTQSQETPYTILGISPNADADEIKKAYRRLAMKYHPDRNNQLSKEDALLNNERFKKITQAYRQLLKGHSQNEFGFNQADGSFFNFGDNFFEDILQTVFGQTYNRHYKNDNQRHSGQSFNFEVNLNIDLKTAFFGGENSLEEELPTLCDCFDHNHLSNDRSCSRCRGEGYFFQKTKVTVQIPHGVTQDEKIIISQQQNKLNTLSIIGTVHILPNEVYMSNLSKGVKNYDLLLDVPITLTEGLLGSKKEIPTLLDNFITITIPPSTTEQTVLEIKNEELFKKLSLRGNIYIRLSVELPQNLSRKQKKLLKLFQKEEKQKNYPKSSLFKKKYKS